MDDLVTAIQEDRLVVSQEGGTVKAVLQDPEAESDLRLYCPAEGAVRMADTWEAYLPLAGAQLGEEAFEAIQQAIAEWRAAAEEARREA